MQDGVGTRLFRVLFVDEVGDRQYAFEAVQVEKSVVWCEERMVHELEDRY